MIHRPNYADVQEFLVYHKETLQHSELTVARYWISLRMLLTWADATPFSRARDTQPTFPTYVLSVRNMHAPDRPLSKAHASRILSDSRRFLTWANHVHMGRYAELTPEWIDSLRLPRSKSMESEYRDVESWSLEEVIRVSSISVDSVAEQRNRAAVAYLYISGMRAGAFLTMPMRCVDIPNRRIFQFPELGVRTKGSKAAITSLLPIPELLAIVNEWDIYLRERLSPSALWFPCIDRVRGDITEQPRGSISAGRNALVEGMRLLCARAGIPYRSPHKLRHGHALYGVKHARTMEELKAVSQNLMHNSISITDGVYGRLATDNVVDILGRLEPQPPTLPSEAATTASSISQLLSVLARLIAEEVLGKPEFALEVQRMLGMSERRDA